MIGIFGGTFDPVHYGHLKPAASVKQALNLTQLRFIPNRAPPHRAKPWLSVAQRVALLESALEDYPETVIDLREIKREGPSYMVDTLKSLKQDFPDEALCLIIGMDAFFSISSWFKWQSIFESCHLVVTTRPGFDQSAIRHHLNSDDSQFLEQKITTDVNLFTALESPREKAKILIQSVPQLNISSTQIRENLQRGHAVKQWMPAGAYQKLRGFINEN